MKVKMSSAWCLSCSDALIFSDRVLSLHDDFPDIHETNSG